MGTPIKDMTGQRFGRLHVLAFGGIGKAKVGALWSCVCDCGTAAIVPGKHLRSGETQSCGCLRIERVAAATRARVMTHGHTTKAGNSKTYRIWSNMGTRCNNPKADNFAYYGGRGIYVCAEWESFDRFLSDMGECPDGHSLDRKDSNGPYSKENCRWATPLEQANNTRRNRHLSIGQETMTMSEAARRFGTPVGTLWGRLKAGWSEAQAVGVEPPPRRYRAATAADRGVNLERNRETEKA